MQVTVNVLMRQVLCPSLFLPFTAKHVYDRPYTSLCKRAIKVNDLVAPGFVVLWQVSASNREMLLPLGSETLVSNFIQTKDNGDIRRYQSAGISHAHLPKRLLQLLHKAGILLDSKDRGASLEQLLRQASPARANLQHSGAWLQPGCSSNGLQKGCIC